MLVNQSIGQHTLALFTQGNASTSPKPNVFEGASKVSAADSPRAAETSEPATTSRFLVSEERLRNPQTAEDRAFAEQVSKYTDAAQRTKLREASQARQAASDKFQAEFGYRNRMTTGLSIAHGMASRQQPGEAGYKTREEALGELGNRISDIRSTAQWVNRARSTTAVPHLSSMPQYTRYTWSGAKDADVAQAALAKLTPEERQMAADKQAHDLKVSGMKFDIAAAELARDFGVSVNVSSSRDSDGRVTLNDFEITSSKYGKLGEVRDGLLFVTTESGDLVESEEYWRAARQN